MEQCTRTSTLDPLFLVRRTARSLLVEEHW